MKGNILISKAYVLFEFSLHTYSEKQASCLAYFSQKFPVNGKITRKSPYSFPVTEQLWQVNAKKNYLFFTETSSAKQFREQRLTIIYCESKMNKIKDMI